MITENIVYCIKNKVSDKLYIGSSSNYKYRKICHLEMLMNNSHHNPILQRDFNKLGKENFIFEILKDNFKTTGKMLEYEYSLINNSSNIYNVLKVNFNDVGVKSSKVKVYQMKSQSMSLVVVNKNKIEQSPTIGMSKNKAIQFRRNQAVLKAYDQQFKDRIKARGDSPIYKRKLSNHS